MIDLANAIHMTVNHQTYFPHWSVKRYARLWIGFNPKEAILSCYIAQYD